MPLESGGDEDDAPSVISTFASEDSELASADDRILVEELLADFAPRERYERGLTQAEIAEALGVSRVQVSRMLRKMIARMQEKLEPADGESAKQSR